MRSERGGSLCVVQWYVRLRCRSCSSSPRSPYHPHCPSAHRARQRRHSTNRRRRRGSDLAKWLQALVTPAGWRITVWVYCWDRNASGQLGDGTTEDRLTPIAVSGLTGAVAIAAGSAHTCAVLANGSARCWGNNDNGQLGNGTTTDRLTPVAVSGLTGAIAIAAGLEHTCALLNDGTARCWGDNFSSQLGDGTAGYSPTPVQVAGSGRGEAPQPLIFYSDDRKAGV